MPVDQKSNQYDRNWHSNILYLLVFMVGLYFFQDALKTSNQTTIIPYSQFDRLLKEKKITSVNITDSHIQGELKEKLENGSTQFITAKVEDELASKLSNAGVEYTRTIESKFYSTLLSWIIPTLIFILFWMFILGRVAKGGFGSQLMSIGKSKAKVYVETNTKVKFEDVAGVDEAKEELLEIVNFLKDKKRFGRLGARIPRGILLVGPPGTGKTLLAKAIAGEAGVPFFSINGSEFVEMFVGVGAARVRDLFDQARSQAPCIIFVDELDALGRSRSVSLGGGGHDEKEQTLNQLLVELDGFDSTSGIVLLAATNRPEILDPALLRSGRFDRQILVDRPDKNGRLMILKVHTKKILLENSVDLEKVAELTAGFTGADIENLANEAALVATRRNADAVTANDFTLAIERIIAGLEKKNRLIREEEKIIIAHHEMGHTLVAAALPGIDPVHKVSIIPRGIGSLGYTIQRPTEDRYLMTKHELENKMTVLLGGRASEKIIFNHYSTGAVDDIRKATSIAREMVTLYGMDEKLGSVTYEENRSTFLKGSELNISGTRSYSEQSSEYIDDAVKYLISNALNNAISILELNRSLLEKSAQILLKKETLVEEDLGPIFKQIKRPTALKQCSDMSQK